MGRTIHSSLQDDFSSLLEAPVATTIPTSAASEPYWVEWERNGRCHPVYGRVEDYPPYDQMLAQAREWALAEIQEPRLPNEHDSFEYLLKGVRGKGRAERTRNLLDSTLAECEAERPVYEAFQRGDDPYPNCPSRRNVPLWLSLLGSMNLVRNHYFYHAEIVVRCEGELGIAPAKEDDDARV